MGIIGENLDLDLSKQIKVRQEKLGHMARDTDDIVYNNSKTPWIRVASSVDITDTNLAGLGDFSSEGGQFAKNLVLFNGATNSTGAQPNKALSTSTNNLPEQVLSQYGIGDSTKWGYSPPPGIESLTIQALNRGAIRKASISIKAHNPDQFRLIEALYLRLGFTILVEWGHSVYFDNEGNLQNRQSFSTLPFEGFMNGSNSFTEITKALIDERNRSSYNYDGFIGYISNFNWTFNEDATYSISLDIITRGGLIDSLSVNRSGGSGDVPGIGNGCLLENIFGYWQDVAKNDPKSLVNAFGGKIKGLGTQTPETELKWKYPLKAGEFLVLNTKVQSDGESTDTPQYYITLGLLLRYIAERALLYEDETINDDIEQVPTKVPLLNIDHKYNNSWMLTHPYQQSTDPKICILTNDLPEATYYFKTDTPQDQRPPDLPADGASNGGVSTPSDLKKSLFRPKSENKFAGDIMGIWLNLEFLTNTLNNNKNDKGEVDLGSYITAILNQVANVTGNINEFSTSYNEDTNSVEIYDNATVPGIAPSITQSTPIHVYGLGSNGFSKTLDVGSFVTKLSFSSKIFPSLQNSIAIAAQNPDGGTTGEKVSSYSRLNQGLRDRLAKGAKPYSISDKTEENQPSPMSRYESQIYLLNEHFITLYNKGILLSQDKIDECSNTLKDVLSYDIDWRVKEEEIPPPFFIPVELSLTMDGIAGFKLYNKFDITPDYILPPSYPNNVNWIVQGITHDLNGGDWTTTINTLSWMAPEKTITLSPTQIIKGGRQKPPQASSSPVTDVSNVFTDPTLLPLLRINSTSALANFGVAKGTVITPEQAVQYLHPQVRTKQLAFLNYMLQEPALRGARIDISSTLRTFAQQDKLYRSKTTTAPAGTSQHNYGCAFDMNIYDQKTGKLVASNNYPGPNIATKTIWTDLGIVRAAQNADVPSWGGNFSSYFDPVHFGVRVNTAASLKTAKEYANKLGIDYKQMGVKEIFDLDITFA